MAQGFLNSIDPVHAVRGGRGGRRKKGREGREGGEGGEEVGEVLHNSSLLNACSNSIYIDGSVPALIRTPS